MKDQGQYLSSPGRRQEHRYGSHRDHHDQGAVESPPLCLGHSNSRRASQAPIAQEARSSRFGNSRKGSSALPEASLSRGRPRARSSARTRAAHVWARGAHVAEITRRFETARTRSAPVALRMRPKGRRSRAREGILKEMRFHLLLLGLVTAGQALEVFLLLVGLSLAGRHDYLGINWTELGCCKAVNGELG